MSPQATRAILFDLDGTLVDSAPDLAAAVDAMMRGLDLPERGEDAVRCWVGNGVEKLVKRALTQQMDGEPEAELFERALPLFWDYYTAHTCVHSQLYPGVREGIDALRARGLRLAVVTNKARSFTERLLAGLGIADDFDALVGGDCLPVKKPDPAPLQHALAQLGIGADEALMVGDSRHDIAAARNAGLSVICVPYGYNHGDDIRDSHPDAVVQRIDELPALLAAAA